MKIIEAMPGDTFATFIQKCVSECTEECTAKFNGIKIPLRSTSDFKDLCYIYDLKMRAGIYD